MREKMEWNDNDEATVEGLGTIRVYTDEDGHCVDINGRRAWSSWRNTIPGIKLDLAFRIREWQYLNSFKVGET